MTYLTAGKALTETGGKATLRSQPLRDRSGAALDTAIFGGHGRDCITDLWSAGRHVVKAGRHIARDRIVQDYKTAIV